MLDRHRRAHGRLKRVSIASGLVPSVTLLEDLVRYLNGTKTVRGEGVLVILEKMLKLEEMTKGIVGPILIDFSLKKTAPEKLQAQLEVGKQMALLNRELMKYPSTFRAEVVRGGRGGADKWVTWRSDTSDKGEERLRMVASEALEVILRLTQIGYLDRLRHCAYCNAWLYAKFRHQTFCSMACQQKKYTHTDQFRAHRREYMRKYYRITYGEGRKKRSSK